MFSLGWCQVHLVFVEYLGFSSPQVIACQYVEPCSIGTCSLVLISAKSCINIECLLEDSPGIRTIFEGSRGRGFYSEQATLDRHTRDQSTTLTALFVLARRGRCQSASFVSISEEKTYLKMS